MAIRPLLLGMGACAALTAGILSWFASAQPDGLEWSLAHTTANAQVTQVKPQEVWPAVDANESAAGLLGAGATMCLVAGVAYLLRRRRPIA